MKSTDRDGNKVKLYLHYPLPVVLETLANNYSPMSQELKWEIPAWIRAFAPNASYVWKGSLSCPLSALTALTFTTT